MSIRICTWNVKGFNNPIEQKAILNGLKKDNAQISLLQETHLNDDEHINTLKRGSDRSTFHLTLQVRGA